jgi:hypothetical protein
MSHEQTESTILLKISDIDSDDENDMGKSDNVHTMSAKAMVGSKHDVPDTCSSKTSVLEEAADSASRGSPTLNRKLNLQTTTTGLSGIVEDTVSVNAMVGSKNDILSTCSAETTVLEVDADPMSSGSQTFDQNLNLQTSETGPIENVEGLSATRTLNETVTTPITNVSVLSDTGIPSTCSAETTVLEADADPMSSGPQTFDQSLNSGFSDNSGVSTDVDKPPHPISLPNPDWELLVNQCKQNNPSTKTAVHKKTPPKTPRRSSRKKGSSSL